MSKKEEKIQNLQDEFSRIQEESKDLDISKYLAKKEDQSQSAKTDICPI